MLEAVLPKIFDTTIRVEPEGRFIASEEACTARPLSKMPSIVDVFKSNVFAVTLSPEPDSELVSTDTEPEAYRICVLRL